MLRKITVLFTVTISLFFYARVAFAATLVMSADHVAAAVGESISVEVKAEGGVDSDPKISHTDGFDVVGTGQSSQFQIINGKMSSSKVFQFELMPQKAGQFTIGPVVAMSNGQKIESNTITINIAADANSMTGKGLAQQIQGEQDAFISLEASNPEPYVNEQIVVKLKFASKVPVQNAQLTPPGFEGFWKEQIGNTIHKEEVINGQVYGVDELRWALFPVHSGKIVIPPMRIVADLAVTTQRRAHSLFDNPFFGNMQETQRRAFGTKETTLNVKDLPLDGKPAGFSNLVGNFSIEAAASTSSVKVGDSVTVTIKVSGGGNVRDIPEPQFADSQKFKIYRDQPAVKVEADENGVKGTKTFTMAVVPLVAGNITIEPFTQSFFDPSTKSYVNIATNPINLSVAPSANPQATASAMQVPAGKGKNEVAVVGRDLMPIVRDSAAFKDGGVGFSLRIIFIVIAMMPLFIFATALVVRSRMLAKLDTAFVRRTRAMKFAKKRCGELEKLKGAEFAERASGVLKDFIGDKLNIDGRSLTSNEIEIRLAPFGFSQNVLKEAATFISECDAGIYGGRQIDSGKQKDMQKKIFEIIKKLDEAI